MTYYINPIWFYLMNVGSSLRVALFVVGALALVFAIATFLCLCDCCLITDMDEDEKKMAKVVKKLIVLGVIVVILGVLIPTKETCIEMMVASQVTHENVNATKEELYDLIDYVTDKVKGEDKE